MIPIPCFILYNSTKGGIKESAIICKKYRHLILWWFLQFVPFGIICFPPVLSSEEKNPSNLTEIYEKTTKTFPGFPPTHP